MMSADAGRRAAVERAVRRYARGTRKARAIRADGDMQLQTDNYRLGCERTELRAEQVRQVIYSLGVPVMHAAAYRGFGLRVDRLIRRYSGPTLTRLVLDAIARWTAFGLRPQVLVAVCRRVFNLEL